MCHLVTGLITWGWRHQGCSSGSPGSGRDWRHQAAGPSPGKPGWHG
ncbi:hypothetical protein DB31_1738 [Hyalangium minutum]|uniref:Uncharacterized protein n=1 Tax=Hyalangium minutum TaxID=394096 RepID=A0A085WAK7_9BACT|nr:hypothetical protein DB31_1738 [Hyalangium minutum]